MSTFVLVRHGENEWVRKNRLAGWIPGVHLNKTGQEQAKAAAARLAHLPVKAVYSSPVTRCMETAVHLAQPHHREVEQVAGLGEVRYGAWEGKKIKKLAKKREWFAVQFFPSRFQFPGGEAMRETQMRMVAALEELNGRHADHDLIIAVSHADLIKLALAYYLGVHIDLFQRIIISPASVSVLHLAANGMVRVGRINDNGPLAAPKLPQKKKGKKKAKAESAHTETAVSHSHPGVSEEE
ncbi:MAG: MSMEG_4193 family putative phosphomutase [Anaerolineae bacterium]